MSARHDTPAARPLDAWSRRKAAVRAEAEAERRLAAEREAEREAARARAALAGRSDAETLAALELPDPDDLAAGDDFAAFMRAAVPEHLRRRALRRLWLSDPVLANLDELLDYGEDYTRGPGVVETVRTAYRVGRGMLGDEESAPAAPGDGEAATEAATEATTGPAAQGAGEDRSAIADARAAGTTAGSAGGDTAGRVSAPADPAPATPADPPAAPRRRRMVFAFDAPGGGAHDPDPTPDSDSNREVDPA